MPNPTAVTTATEDRAATAQLGRGSPDADEMASSPVVAVFCAAVLVADSDGWRELCAW